MYKNAETHVTLGLRFHIRSEDTRMRGRIAGEQVRIRIPIQTNFACSILDRTEIRKPSQVNGEALLLIPR